MANELVKADTSVEKTDQLPEPTAAYKQAIDLLRSSVGEMYDLVKQNSEDLDGQARVLLILDRLRGDMMALGDEIKGNMARLAPSYKFTIEGVGTFQKCKAGQKTVWDDDQVWDYLKSHAYENEPVTERDAVEHLVDLVQEFARVDWRVTPFKDRGVDVEGNGFAEKDGGRPSVRPVSGGIAK